MSSSSIDIIRIWHDMRSSVCSVLKCTLKKRSWLSIHLLACNFTIFLVSWECIKTISLSNSNKFQAHKSFSDKLQQKWKVLSSQNRNFLLVFFISYKTICSKNLNTSKYEKFCRIIQLQGTISITLVERGFINIDHQVTYYILLALYHQDFDH